MTSAKSFPEFMSRGCFLIFTVWLAASIGCTPPGDGIVNLTDYAVVATIRTETGSVRTLEIPPGEHFVFPGRDRRLSEVDAGGPDGNRLGRLHVTEQLRRGKYPKRVLLIVTDEGVFPVPKRFLDIARLAKHKDDIIRDYDSVPKSDR